MSKKEKLLERFRQNPKNVRFEEIETVLSAFGFRKRKGEGSHATFIMGSHVITVPRPHRTPFVKRCYVDLLLEELDKIQELEDE